MDSLDLLQQNAYPNSPLSQNTQYQDHHHHQQQQQQMNIASFQDNSFEPPEVGTDLQFCTNERKEDSSGENCNSHSIELVQDINLDGEEIDGHSNSQSSNYSTGLKTEIDKTLQNSVSEAGRNIDISGDGDGEATDDCDDEDAAFVALCTDASSVLNKHDPTRRYYINKLYQPLHNNQDETPIEEQDDEYLLYQELRYLETQESTDDRQRVQLTKILEDDDGDEDVEHLAMDSGQREDPLDRLHLTTIIETFESFPTSPLIDSSDPLIGGVCSVSDQCQDKPDSTRRGDSPMSSSNANNYIDLAHNTHQQFAGNLQLAEIDDHREDPSFSSITSENPMNHDSHHNHLHPQHHHIQHHDQQDVQQQYDHHINSDISSENNCFQQVSSTFIQPSDSNNSNSPDFLSSFQNSNEVQEQLEENQTHSKNLVRQPKKRSLQQAIQNENATRITSLKTTKNRAKKKRTSSFEEADVKEVYTSNENSVSPIDGVTSSMMNQIETARCSTSDSNSSTIKIDGHQQKSITEDLGDEDDGSMSMEEGSVSNGGRGHHTSKYRRRTANARERIRMREINQAFEKLKKVVPIELIQQSVSGDESDQTSVSSRRGGKSTSNSSGQQSDSQSVKLTKITTLRLAVSYIAKLSEVLNQHPESNLSNIESRSSNSETNSSSATLPTLGSLKAKNTDLGRGRKRRSRSSTKRSVDEIKTKIISETIKPDISLKNSFNHNDSNTKKDSSSELRVEPAIVLNQTNQRRPILISNHILNGGLQQQASTTFLPLQQDNSSQSDVQQPQQQQFAYGRCSQQPLTISQTTPSNGQDRTFVTPVAVAILGIPAASNHRGLNEHQGIQLLGIQNAQQLQQRTQHIQTANAPYGLITQHPQQLAFTLNDLNGLSLVRLANTQNHALTTTTSQPQTIQFQQGGSIIQQPQVLATTHASGYNYTTTYQPVHISQVQTTNMASVRPLNGSQQQHQQAATVQFRACNSVDGRTQETHLLQFSNDLRATISHRNIAISDNSFTKTTSNSSPSINTGTNRNFSISPNMIAQHLNNNSINNSNSNFNNSNNNINDNNSNSIQATQFKLQQSNCSEGQIVSSNNMLPQGTRIFQSQPAASRCNTISSNSTQANLIYINPTTISNASELQRATFQQPTTIHQLDSASICNQADGNANNNSNNIISSNQLVSSQVDTQTSSNSNAPTYEQMKFVTQFSSQVNQNQDKNFHANEANIRQLVASLATSIQPNNGADQSTKTNKDEQASEQQQQQQQRQQPKRTYRFHNYDGNMITNHLYNNHDKNGHHHQQDQQQQSVKRNNQQQQLIQLDQLAKASTATTTSSSSTITTTITSHSTNGNSGNGQRSRQNSLSSTCSTNSCSSSSLTSLSTASPLLSMMVKSPSLENGSSNTVSGARSMIEETTGTEVVGCN